MPYYAFKNYDLDLEVLKEYPVGKAPKSLRCKGVRYQRVYSASFIVPPYMKASGNKDSSSDACDRQAVYLQSDRHRQDMLKNERIAKRHEEAHSRKDKFVKELNSKIDTMRRKGDSAP